MGSWARSHFGPSRAEGLVRKGLLCKRTERDEWGFPEMEEVPTPPAGYVVSFAHFHERGFATPPSLFFRGLLHYYGLELQHLNPNGIQHVAAFVALCEGFLGIEPNFSLWKYFFTVSLYLKAEERGNQQRSTPVPIGCAGIHLRHPRAKEYMAMKTAASHKGWHQQWFYVKNYSNSPLPEFTGRVIEVAPEVWSYGPVEKEKKRITGLLQAIEHLKGRGLTGAGVIGAYHARRVAPLMLRVRPLSEMTPGAPTEGTVLATGALAASEIRRRVREALEDKDADYPVPGHPPMRPDENFVDLGNMTRVVDSRPPEPEDAERRQQNRLLAEKQKRRKDKGLNPVPPSATSADPVVQSIAPGGPPAGEVIDLDADEAEEAAVATEGEFAPAATAGTAGAEEAGTPAPAAATEEEAVTGTSARGATAEVAAAVEAEVPAPEATTGAGTPALVATTEGEAATGTLAPAPASEAVAPTGGSGRVLAPAVAAATSTGARAPGPSVRPTPSGAAAPTSSAASGAAAALASATPVPKAWNGSILRWTSRDDPQRPLFTLDDAAEWGKWQALQGGLANVRAAVSSALGKLDGAVFPGGRALQECSRGKSNFLRFQRGLWERFNLERQRTGELTMQVAAAQQVIDDLRRREQAAQEDARRAEAKFQVVAERARCDREEFQAAAEKARHDAEELARLKGVHEALQKTVERIRRERQKAWQDRDAEKVRKKEAEKVAANLGAEVSQLQVQARELQASVAQGLDRERQLKAQSADELARLREVLDAERTEHGALRDAVRVVCDDLSVVQGEGTSSLATRVLGTYRRAREIALEALHTGVRRAFGVFGSHYSGINFAGMSGGYAAGYSEAELDEIDASVLDPAEALAKLLKDEAVPPEDPRTS
ncbi:uncharacterized protein [Setaria viridis]|uniref:Transposase (putative) gypsy type domain-containing protein n=1 Tax=Setaria viridis TaxID=4556 RepID=A0A4V6D4P3_SETVI|nr:hypothetical protein SEVIR_7G296803v2 [Setaria viridis]